MRSAVSVTDPIEATGPKAEHVKERGPILGPRDAAPESRPQYGALMTTYVVLPPE